MKLLALLMLAAVLQVSAKGFAQEKITISVDNAPLEKVINSIKKQSGFYFVYRPEMVAGKTISIHLTNATLKDALDQCLKPQKLTYNIVGNSIVISPSGNNNIVINEKSAVNTPIDVKGRVVNEKGEPLSGASVRIKGSDLGVNTDATGSFELKGVNEDAILEVSFVGYESRFINVRKNQLLLVNLEISVSELDVTVIKGYYTTTKRFNTGSVSRVSETELQKQPVSNPLAALEGRLTGVQVIQNSGVPGGGFTVQIRGQNSLRNTSSNNGNLPLYIIDGVPFTPQSLSSSLTSGALFTGGLPSALNNINMSDIASIEVLKDADATAIYGSRGANGVILITTKKGKAGKTKVDLNAYTGWGKVASKIDLMDTRQYLDMRYEALRNDGVVLNASTPRAVDLKLWDTTRFTDWQKELIGSTAKITNAQFAISGGNANTQFLFGGGYLKESSVYPGNNDDRKSSGHFNLSHISQNNHFKANFSSSYLVDKNDLPPLDLTSKALNLAPVAPKLYDSVGNLNWESSSWTNPLSYTKQRYTSSTQTLIANTVLSYQLFNGLQVKTSMGYTTMNLKEIYTIPISSQDPAFVPTASAYYSNGYANTWIVEPGMEYQTTIGQGKLSALVGSTFQESIVSRQTISGSGFTNDALLSNFVNAASISKLENPFNQYRYAAVYGRIGYDWKNKYLINLTGRRDGSSRFGPGKHWANFGAVGLGWIFSDESVLKEHLTFLSYGKIRSSYGITGSDQIGDYGFLDTYSSTSNPYNGISGLYPTRIANPDYSWETNKKFEVALELGLFTNKILLNVNWYQNRSSNQLVGFPIPLTTGFSTVQANFPATVQNTGWELELNAKIINRKNFNWTAGVNLTIPRNKLISYPNIKASTYSTTYAVGEPLFIRYLYAVSSVDPQTGAYLYLDSTGKATATPVSNDRRFIKAGAQDFFGGFQNSLSYKGFQLEFLVQFVKQTARNYFATYGSAAGVFNANVGNRPTHDLERWQHPDDLANIQKFTQQPGSPAYSAWATSTSSNLTVSEASYVRLKNLSLSHQLPLSLVKKMKIEALRFYVQGQNLITITNFLGLDPETQGFNLPPIKMLTLGFQITL